MMICSLGINHFLFERLYIHSYTYAIKGGIEGPAVVRRTPYRVLAYHFLKLCAIPDNFMIEATPTSLKKFMLILIIGSKIPHFVWQSRLVKSTKTNRGYKTVRAGKWKTWKAGTGTGTGTEIRKRSSDAHIIIDTKLL